MEQRRPEQTPAGREPQGWEQNCRQRWVGRPAEHKREGIGRHSMFMKGLTEGEALVGKSAQISEGKPHCRGPSRVGREL